MIKGFRPCSLTSTSHSPVLGSQARFLQDEPPSQLDHVKTVLQVYADQLKTSAHKALNHLDDTEFKDYKYETLLRLGQLFG